MADTRNHDDTYEFALEQTAPAEQFSAVELRRKLEATAMDRTPEETAQRYLLKTATDSGDTASVEATAEITHFGETRDLPPDMIGDIATEGPRFRVVSEVGEGATSHVYAVQDTSLNRTIAVKFLKQRRSHKKSVARRFIHEARVTAMLEHPNIMPVHDIGLTGDNEVFFAMKNVTGCSLGDAIRAARDGRSLSEEFESLDGRVRIFLKVCDALEYAHAHGFIHQDIKPDNIMLGEYGEVLVLDWGSALARDSEVESGKVLYGTPAYMSPEQARRERADERSDVYCIGATFFHALLLRHPTWSTDPEGFWEKKRDGVIDDIADDERARVPAALLDIALKAMHADASERYQTVEELSDDLKHYQAGQAVSAHRESVVERFARWYRNNTRVFWTATVGAVLVLGVGSLLMREKVKEWITWRSYHAESFGPGAGERLVRDWQATVTHDWRTAQPEAFSDSGTWRIEDGALVGETQANYSNVCFARSVPGDMRVEWDARLLSGVTNLNCFIAGRTRREGYTFHVGGFSRIDWVAMTKGNQDQLVDTSTMAPLEEGRTYRLRMEKEGQHIRFFIDDRKLIDYDDPNPLRGLAHQTFGFECFEGREVAIDNIVVQYHPLPLKVSVLDAADQFAETGHFADALERYREIMVLFPDHDVARRAHFRAAQCLAELDSTPQALESYRQFYALYPQHEYAPRALHAQSVLLRGMGMSVEADSVLTRLGAEWPGHPILHSVFGDMTRTLTTALMDTLDQWYEDSSDDRSAERWCLGKADTLMMWRGRFGLPAERNVFLGHVARQLWVAGRLGVEEIVERFPSERREHATMLVECGQHERVLSDYRDQRSICALALVDMGRYREVLQTYPTVRPQVCAALLALGEYERVVDSYVDQSNSVRSALWGLGRHDEYMAGLSLGVGGQSERVRRLGLGEQYLQDASRQSQAGVVLAEVLGQYDSALSVLARVPDRRRDIPYWLTVGRSWVELGKPATALRALNRVPHLEQFSCEVHLGMGEPAVVHRRFPFLPIQRAGACLEQGLIDSAQMYAAVDLGQRVKIGLLCGQAQQLYDEHPGFPRIRADALLLMGEYDRVLTEYPDQHGACTSALLLLGRYEQVLTDYPDRRDACIAALHRLGRAKEALEQFPESRQEYALYLVTQGRSEEVVERFPDQPYPYSLALVHLGRESEIPWGQGPVRLTRTEWCRLSGVRAVWAAREGRWQEALQLIENAGPPYHLPPDRRFVHYLLKPMLLGLQGNSGALRTACRNLMAAHTHTFGQRLLHESGFLSGALDSAAFMAQPVSFTASERLLFLQAVRLDIDGDHDAARQRYRALADNVRYRECDQLELEGYESYLRPLVASDALRAFVRWRLLVLEGDHG